MDFQLTSKLVFSFIGMLFRRSVTSSLELGLIELFWLSFRGVTFSFSTAASLSLKQDVDENVVKGHRKFKHKVRSHHLIKQSYKKYIKKVITV